jgi:hypothetical protein
MPIAEDSCNAKTGQNSARKQHWPGKFSLPPLATARFLKKRTQHTISTSCQLFPKKQSADEKKQRREKNNKNNQRKKAKEETRRDTSGFLLSLHRGTAKTRKPKPKPPLYRDTRQSPPKASDQQQLVRYPFFLGGERLSPLSTRLKLSGL